MNKLKYFSLALLFCTFPVAAQTVAVEETRVEGLLTDELAFFGLSQEDVELYNEIMRTTPASKWYEHLDPAEVLGIMARTDEERAKYATLTAKGAYERLDRELKFMHAYNDAYKRLYPAARVIQRTANRDSYFIGPSDSLIYFTALDDRGIAPRLEKLMILMNKYETTLTVYFLDDSRPSKQIAFLAQSGVARDDLKSKRVVIADGRVPDAVWMQSSPLGATGIRYQSGEIEWIYEE